MSASSSSPQTGGYEAGKQAGLKEGAAKTLAQTACLVIGIALVGAGILGFIFGGSGFDTGDAVQGKEFLGLEVNGWHNIVHIATGALLLFASPKAKIAGTVLLVFGVVYALVTILGVIDGADIVNLLPINAADNVLHAILAVAAIVIALTAGALGKSSRNEAQTA